MALADLLQQNVQVPEDINTNTLNMLANHNKSEEKQTKCSPLLVARRDGLLAAEAVGGLRLLRQHVVEDTRNVDVN